MTITSTYFEYKTKIIGNTPDDNNTLGTDVVIPLKYLSNWSPKSLDLSLINLKIKHSQNIAYLP